MPCSAPSRTRRANSGRRRCLWDLVEAIRGAATDSRIRVLVLDLDKMEGAGQPELEELASAIGDFHASGKPVIAFGTTYDQEQYYLAAQADKVYLDPTGFVMIEGYARYSLYFKGLLQKLGVDVNVFNVGTFKSAVEIFTRDDMSPADKQQSQAYLNVLWSSYQKAVTTARKLPAGAIASYVDSLPQAVSAANGDAAKRGLACGAGDGARRQTAGRARAGQPRRRATSRPAPSIRFPRKTTRGSSMRARRSTTAMAARASASSSRPERFRTAARRPAPSAAIRCRS